MGAVGVFCIAADHPALPGHFPGRPIVPGVVLLDHVAALILIQELGRDLAGFPSVRFSRPVRPGESVAVSYLEGRFTGQVDGVTVLSGVIAFR